MSKVHLEHPTQATACGTVATQFGVPVAEFETVSERERCQSCKRTLIALREGRPAYRGALDEEKKVLRVCEQTCAAGADTA